MFLREQMDQLANATDQAAANSHMQAWLGLMANSPQYSTRNMLLVLFQDPDATHVGSAKYWMTLGRELKANATQLWVQAPVRSCNALAPDAERLQSYETLPVSDGTDLRQKQHAKTRHTRKRVGFIDVPIYDVRSTAGSALPEIPEWRSLSQRTDLHDHLGAFAQAKGINVEVAPLRGNMQGLSMRGSITLDPNAGTKTFVHELMHELLPHHDSWIPTHVREWQAEIGAYLVCARFGVEGLNCPNYLAGWTASGKQVRKQFEIAAEPARDLIHFIESRMGLHPVVEVDDAT
ncbi:MAG: hypothetical protein HC853_00160 [Anaerolineae bacterium]|nr:hypothetical protein [Anaerolineae bacterium]